MIVSARQAPGGGCLLDRQLAAGGTRCHQPGRDIWTDGMLQGRCKPGRLATSTPPSLPPSSSLLTRDGDEGAVEQLKEADAPAVPLSQDVLHRVVVPAAGVMREAAVAEGWRGKCLVCGSAASGEKQPASQAAAAHRACSTPFTQSAGEAWDELAGLQCAPCSMQACKLGHRALCMPAALHTSTQPCCHTTPRPIQTRMHGSTPLTDHGQHAAGQQLDDVENDLDWSGVECGVRSRWGGWEVSGSRRQAAAERCACKWPPLARQAAPACGAPLAAKQSGAPQ